MSGKKPAKTEAEEIIEGLGRGEGIPSGWAFDVSKDPIVFKVEEIEAEPAEETDGAAED